MAQTAVKVTNPETGVTGDLDVNKLSQALAMGARLAQPVELFNPETQQTGMVDPDKAPKALELGAIPVGSHEHAKATTGKLESFGRGAAQGLTGGFADELVGALESAAGSLGLTKQDKTYQQARDESRANFQTAEEANPVSSALGTITGGAASMAVPGMGAVGHGLGGAILTGAKLGAISGLGNSTADLTKGDFAGAMKDTTTGAGMGGALGGATYGAGKVLGFVGSKAKDMVGDAFDPALQRLLALGAKAKDLVDPRNDYVREAVPVLEKMGLFARNSDNSVPSSLDLEGRLSALKRGTIDSMKDAVDKAGNTRLDVGDIITALRNETADVFSKAVPGSENNLTSKLDDVLQKVMDTDGDLYSLWELKKNSGSWAKWQQNRSTDENKLYQAVNQALNKDITAATDAVANRAGGAAGVKLADLNRQYGAISNVEKMLASSRASEQASSNPFGIKFTDVGGVGMMAGLGGLVGGPVGAQVAATGGMAAGAALRSTEGRLLRAEVGQALQQKAVQAQQAIMQGAIPRTLDGLKQWVGQNMQTIQMQMPQLAPIAQRFLGEPPGVAEMTVRTMMPLLTQHMTPSAYPSEFDGHVFEPQDRLKITKQLGAVKGLSLADLAARRSELNLNGKIPAEVYAPPPPGASLDDQIAQFSASLEKMGY